MHILFKKTSLGYEYRFENFVWVFSSVRQNYGLFAIPSRPEKAEIILARKQFLSKHNMPALNSVFLQQVHGTCIVAANNKHKGRGLIDFDQGFPETDAVVTNEYNLPLCVLTADCMPIAFFCQDKNVAGIIHAGWRGLKDGIISKTVTSICRKYDTNSEKIKIFIGPYINKCCYKVSNDFIEKLGDSVELINGDFYADLMIIALKEFKESGIVNENILNSGFCTSCCNDEFFSFRCGDKYQRMMSAIMLVKNQK